MKSAKIVIWAFIVTFGCAKVKVLQHDEHAAAMSAEEFAQTAFVERQNTKAYELAGARLKKEVTFDKFKTVMQNLHPKGVPGEVKAKEFEPIPGHEGMHIFLEGRNDNEQFFYRITMEGTAPKGYKVAGIWRGNGPYPPSNMRRVLK